MLIIRKLLFSLKKKKKKKNPASSFFHISESTPMERLLFPGYSIRNRHRLNNVPVNIATSKGQKTSAAGKVLI